jgi:2-polyprenyl-6-methoxyphenol hydroxylase-like FAD-dependent oxidoreductase
VGHLLVFLVNHRQHLFGGEGVNVGAIGVAALGQQFAQVDTHRNLFIHSGAQYKELIIPFM